jgi:hypothetical protein
MMLIPLQVARSATGDPLPFFDLQVTLDGVTYSIEFRWNTRGLAWFINVWDEQLQTLFLAGVRLVVNYPLANWITGRQPPGALAIIDTSGLGIDPGLGDLGVRHQLYYGTAAELAALG